MSGPASGAFLLDCGASSLVALKKAGIDRGAIDAILLTHFHADHFGGIPFFILDQQLNVKRTRPLLIAGPPGLRDWYARAMALAFPGERTLPFELDAARGRHRRGVKRSPGERSRPSMSSMTNAPAPASPSASKAAARRSVIPAIPNGPRC